MIAVTTVSDRYHSLAGLSFENLFTFQKFSAISLSDVREARCKNPYPGKVFSQLSNRGIKPPDDFTIYRYDDRNYIGKKNKTMLHYLLAFVIFIHGLLHLMGYSKAFKYSGIKHIRAHISRPIGILWIMGCLFFIATGVLLLWNNDYWQIVGLISIAISQIVIIIS